MDTGCRQLFLKSFAVMRTREMGVGLRAMWGCRGSFSDQWLCEHVCIRTRRRRRGPVKEHSVCMESDHLRVGLGQALPCW